uniref:Hypervirulence associated protein TUDOR domain-containing protein n=1 Tax=Peronospora matthiolae TaxID=2874970 RepID=A0AAV1TMU0_9STRA
MRSCAVNAVRKTPEHSGEEDMVAEEAMTPKDNHEINDPLQGQSNRHPDGIKVEYREVHVQSTRLDDDVKAVTNDGEVMQNDEPDESTYYHK